MVTEDLSLFWPLENIMAIFCAVQRVFKQKGEELGRELYTMCILEDEIKFWQLKSIKTKHV